ncbi:unnamed protein product, partial [Didymodactylos carnosus]
MLTLPTYGIIYPLLKTNIMYNSANNNGRTPNIPLECQ